MSAWLGFDPRLRCPLIAEAVEDLFSRSRGATTIRCAAVPSNKDSGSAHSRFQYSALIVSIGAFQQPRPQADPEAVCWKSELFRNRLTKIPLDSSRFILRDITGALFSVYPCCYPKASRAPTLRDRAALSRCAVAMSFLRDITGALFSGYPRCFPMASGAPTVPDRGALSRCAIALVPAVVDISRIRFYCKSGEFRTPVDYPAVT